MGIEKVGYTAAEAAEALGISQRLFDQLDAAGLIARIDFGVGPTGVPRRVKRFSIDALRDFAASRRRYPPADELQERRRRQEERDGQAKRPEAHPTSGRPVGRVGPGRTGKPRSSGQALPLRSVAE